VALHSVRKLLENRVYELIVLQLLLGAATLVAGTTVRLIGLALGVGVAVAATAGVRELSSRLRRRRLSVEAVEGRPQVPRRGIVLTLSADSDLPGSAAVHALHHLRPLYVGFFGTPLTDDRRVVETILTERCPEAEIVPLATNRKTWDLADLRDGKRTVELLIDWLLDRGLAPGEILVDITGGTKTMSVCAFLAAQAKGVDCQYIQSDWDASRRQRGSERFTLIS
jgi:CRISPR-associated protein (Cas_Cas02710)